MFRNKRKGIIGIVEIAAIVLVLGVIGFVTWRMMDDSDTNKTSTETTPTSETSDTGTTVTEASSIPKGWVEKTDSKTGIKYAVDSDWPDETVLTRYKVDENIHVGYGAPVYVRYNSSTNKWETLETNSDNVPVVRREDNIVKKSLTQVGDELPTAIYGTGDGPCGAIRVVFVSNNHVIQIALPEFCGSTSADEAEADWITKESAEDYENALPEVIASVILP